LRWLSKPADWSQCSGGPMIAGVEFTNAPKSQGRFVPLRLPSLPIRKSTTWGVMPQPPQRRFSVVASLAGSSMRMSCLVSGFQV